MSTTPASLLVRLQQPNDVDAWHEFVRLYTPLLYTWACRLGMQEADADDYLQDVFTTVARKIPTFQYDPSRSFRGWLRTILTNAWREQFRRQTPVQLSPEQADALPDTSEPPFPEREEELLHLLRSALDVVRDQFEPQTWQAFAETMLQSRPIADVAAELKMTPNAVYVARARVVKRLRQELDGLLD
jgi:RNA polymerase sigma-70 factor (ECF subfamily)